MSPRDAPGLTRGPFRTCAQTLRDTIAQLQTDIESERGNDANHSIKQAMTVSHVTQPAPSLQIVTHKGSVNIVSHELLVKPTLQSC